MRFRILHEIRGRMRIHAEQKTMSFEEADILQYYLSRQKFVTAVKVYERTQDIVVCYVGERREMLAILRGFRYEQAEVPEAYLQSSVREWNRAYWDQLVTKVVVHYGSRVFLPYPIRAVMTVVRSVKYIRQGIASLIKGRVEVPVLDGAAVGVSVLRGDVKTAASVMFLLGIGEMLEDWTHKKSVSDLARSMSLNVSRVWKAADGGELLVDASTVKPGELIIVHMGNVIPFDGCVMNGEGMVNQASLTGESVPVFKSRDGYVYAGTVVEEGELTIQVKATAGATRYEKIVTMIEETEKLKSAVEGKAVHLADKLVPYTLLGTGLTYLLTRNITRALSVLMVDFSCALKLATPISVLSAIREAGLHNITVKGGRFLEAVAEADTVVFDKTGTLTKAKPTVVRVISFSGESEDELLRTAACLEEHFPHSMARAVVDAALEKNLVHEEKHSKVEYIVAHGISSTIDGKRAVIGSYHFVFEDEKCVIPEGKQELFESLPEEYSHLYLAVEGVLSAVICIEDPLREEAAAVMESLRKSGISKLVMMTGDSERTASVIAQRVGVDQYASEVLPEDKADFVEREREAGRRVIMIGDGINDSPALSAADVGIAISDGAELAREIADITVGADNLFEIVNLKAISNGLMNRIHKNYVRIVTVNAGLIVLGVAGILPPAVSALLHNTSTLAISLQSMKNLLDE